MQNVVQVGHSIWQQLWDHQKPGKSMYKKLGFLTSCLSILLLVSLFVWDIPRKLTAGQMTTSMEQGLI
jgi:hypothetical protein